MATVNKSQTENQNETMQVTLSEVIFKETGVYINPLTNFGFKRLFGTEANKDLLIDFLNAFLDIEGGIKDLQYTNTEKQGHAKKDWRTE